LVSCLAESGIPVTSVQGVSSISRANLLTIKLHSVIFLLIQPIEVLSSTEIFLKVPLRCTFKNISRIYSISQFSEVQRIVLKAL